MSEAVAQMKPEITGASEPNLAELYRDRADRLRKIASILSDAQQVQLLGTIADDYEQLARKLAK